MNEDSNGVLKTAALSKKHSTLHHSPPKTQSTSFCKQHTLS